MKLRAERKDEKGKVFYGMSEFFKYLREVSNVNQR